MVTNYLKNQSNLYYKIIKFSKKKDTMTLEDPHTQEEFQITGIEGAMKLGQFKIIRRRDPS